MQNASWLSASYLAMPHFIWIVCKSNDDKAYYLNVGAAGLEPDAQLLRSVLQQGSFPCLLRQSPGCGDESRPVPPLREVGEIGPHHDWHRFRGWRIRSLTDLRSIDDLKRLIPAYFIPEGHRRHQNNGVRPRFSRRFAVAQNQPQQGYLIFQAIPIRRCCDNGGVLSLSAF